jgi:hypothetical protein
MTHHYAKSIRKKLRALACLRMSANCAGHRKTILLFREEVPEKVAEAIPLDTSVSE